MTLRLWLLTVFAAAVTVTCVRLGFWQLDRRSERLAENEAIAARLARPEMPLEQLLPEAADDIAFSRVRLRGTYDVGNEIVLTRRSRGGAPGVQVLTPLLHSGGAVLVNRGWVYAPDGSSIQLEEWREGIGLPDGRLRSDTLEVHGLIVQYAAASAADSGADHTLRRTPTLSRQVLSRMLPYGVADVVVQLLPLDTLFHPGVPVPLPVPRLSAGPHLSYAIQWFAFALISVVGTTAVVRKSLLGSSEKAGPGAG